MRHRAPVRRLATVALLAAVMAACGGNDPNASTSTSTGGSTDNTTAATDAPVLTNAPTTTNAEVKPAAGGSLVVGIDADASDRKSTRLNSSHT